MSEASADKPDVVNMLFLCRLYRGMTRELWQNSGFFPEQPLLVSCFRFFCSSYCIHHSLKILYWHTTVS
jgi:hypothetical protein